MEGSTTISVFRSNVWVVEVVHPKVIVMMNAHKAYRRIIVASIRREDILRFHVGGIYRGVRCDERYGRSGKARNEPARHAPRMVPETFFSAFITPSEAGHPKTFGGSLL